MIILTIVQLTLMTYYPIDTIKSPYLLDWVPLKVVLRYWTTVDETVIRT